ncbi:inosine-uridine preferring nucleoside hydrolase [Lentilactobacillus farraginis DSM 18382 = JCM 14108]|uniref:Inosine-uridine preferring nucleoside hydrolase n=1 Tax=Lentilactobacillus farraginis DSM 18382 = JCM 14108 TaxID=1423743 RepID=X0PBG7_9LACO|nr:inosine-uridine preferring nucleoside hydrolase [Lentilactobacillus farraginis DSM 18382 = JCM 14108]
MTIKIVMDTDPGIDDAAALTMALNDPQIDVKLITSVAGNVTVDKTTRNAQKIVRFFNKKVPVAAGAKQPLIKEFEDAARIHGESGMPGYDFPEDLPKPLDKSAVEALRETIMSSDEKITLVPTGSYTNIGLLFSEYPEVKDHIERIVAMGGSLGKGNMTSAAEFNVFTDPDAAKIMYNSGIPITMVGLDITMKALLTPASLTKLATMNETGKMLHDIIIHDGDNSLKELPCTMSIQSFIYYIPKQSRPSQCGSILLRTVRQLAKRLAIFVAPIMKAKQTLMSVSILTRPLLTTGSC